MKNSNFTIYHFLLFVLIFFLACGCSKKTPSPEDLNASGFSEKFDERDELNKQILDVANLYPEENEYLLNSGDLIEVKVFESEKLTTSVRISSRGDVSLPLLGEISIKGLTASEAETLIEKKYKETYIKDPHVIIFIKEYFKQKITVVGEVQTPGTYDHFYRQRLLDVIAIAGGLTEKAGNTVQVRRLGSEASGINQSLLIDLSEIVNAGKTDLNISIQGGDVIYVPEAGSFYVDGAVRRPGEYHIRKNVSIRKAILSAGGFAPYADINDLVLIREKEDGTIEEIKVDLEKDVSASDELIVQNKDMITVNASFWGKIAHGAGINIGVPGFGVSFRNP